jgi:hypothetical protein
MFQYFENETFGVRGTTSPSCIHLWISITIIIIVWNSVAIADSNKLERIQRKFAALCHNRFLRDMEYHYDNLLELFNLLTLHNRRRHFGALFLVNVFGGTKFWPSVLETVGRRVPTRPACSLALLDTAHQLDVFQPQMQYVNLQIDLKGFWRWCKFAQSYWACFGLYSSSCM